MKGGEGGGKGERDWGGTVYVEVLEFFEAFLVTIVISLKSRAHIVWFFSNLYYHNELSLCVCLSVSL